MLRRHALFVGLLATGAALRALVTVGYRPALFYSGDTYSYLETARSLVPDVQRPALYSLFLKALLIFREVDVVTVSQHAIGLGVAALVYALLVHLLVRPWLAAIATVPVLLDPLQITSEHTILTETLFEGLAVAALAMLAWRGIRSPVAACLVGALLAAATLTRTVGLVLLLPALAYMLVRRYGAVRIAAWAGGVAVPLVAYAVWFHGAHGRYAVQDWDGHFLYGRVAPFADCGRLGSVRPEERPLCRPRGSVPYRPTWYVFHPDSPITRVTSERGESVDEIAGDFARRVIAAQPATYVRTVAGDFARYFQPIRRTGPLEDPLDETQFPRDAVASREPKRAVEAIRRLEHDPTTGPAVVDPVARFVTRWQDVAYVPGPLLALALLVGAWASLFPTSGHDGRRAATALFTSSALGLLIVPVATVVFDYRHLVPALPVIAVSAGLAGDFLVSAIGSGARPTIPAHRSRPRYHSGVQ